MRCRWGCLCDCVTVRLDGCSLAVVHGALRACSAAVLPLQHLCREAVASTPRPIDEPTCLAPCLPPTQVSDPFSAVALKGLFEALLAEGCVVVATSNRAPAELDRWELRAA